MKFRPGTDLVSNLFLTAFVDENLINHMFIQVMNEQLPKDKG